MNTQKLGSNNNAVEFTKLYEGVQILQNSVRSINQMVAILKRNLEVRIL
jgi:hypothetical protein